nr:CHAT domain-containing protein [Nocardia bovistercoris]
MRPRATATPTPPTPADFRRRRAELAATIAEIRSVPGLSLFRKPASVDDIRRAASDGPLVYLSSTGFGGQALVVASDGSVERIRLDDLTASAVQQRTLAVLRDPARELDAVGDWLWTSAMDQILSATRGQQLITLVPAGQLTFLPWHAAWTPDTAYPAHRRYALDDRLITYAPNAAAVLHARSRLETTTASRILVVDEPEAARGGRLPTSVLECDAALAGYAGTARTRLRGRSSTRENVLEALAAADVAHLSCHAQASLVEPLRTRLELANHSAVSIADILATPLNLRLAVLSACQTAQIGTATIDEAIGFPTALVRAGAAAVISSLWSVPQFSTSELMIRFYRELYSADTTCAEALRRAQQQVRDGTARDKREMLSELSSAATAGIATARPESRPHARPLHWAALNRPGLVGDSRFSKGDCIHGCTTEVRRGDPCSGGSDV